MKLGAVCGPEEKDGWLTVAWRDLIPILSLLNNNSMSFNPEQVWWIPTIQKVLHLVLQYQMILRCGTQPYGIHDLIDKGQITLLPSSPKAGNQGKSQKKKKQEPTSFKLFIKYAFEAPELG